MVHVCSCIDGSRGMCVGNEDGGFNGAGYYYLVLRWSSAQIVRSIV